MIYCKNNSNNEITMGACMYILYISMYIIMVVVYAKAWTTERQISPWDSNTVSYVYIL